VCQACDTRFYDLLRDPIVCPSCGVRYVSEVPQASEAPAGTFTDKTGWRRKAFKRPEPDPDEADIAANDNATEGASEETPPGPDSDDDLVLDEQEQGEADVTAFVDHRNGQPNER
jgi:uncharacterized protein (TIGR02300 family)